MPLPAILAKVAVSAVAGKVGKAINQKEVEAEIERRIKDDPQLKNEMNAEPLIQSRVANGSALAAVGVLLPYILPLIGVDIDDKQVMEILQAVVTLAGAGYAFAGRAFTWSRPMWSRIGRIFGRS